MTTLELNALFTVAQLKQAAKIHSTGKGQPGLHAKLRDEVVVHAMARINEATGQENDADYFAYVLEHAFGREP